MYTCCVVLIDQTNNIVYLKTARAQKIRSAKFLIWYLQNLQLLQGGLVSKFGLHQRTVWQLEIYKSLLSMQMYFECETCGNKSNKTLDLKEHMLITKHQQQLLVSMCRFHQRKYLNLTRNECSQGMDKIYQQAQLKTFIAFILFIFFVDNISGIYVISQYILLEKVMSKEKIKG